MKDAPRLFPELPPIVENPYAGRVGRPPWLRLRILTLLKARGPLPTKMLARNCKRKPSRLTQPLTALLKDGWIEQAGEEWQLRKAA